MILVSSEKIRQYVAAGFWSEERLDTLLDRAAAAFPDREALVDPPNRHALLGGPPRRLSWAEVDRASSRFALGLVELGIGKDDVVCVQLPNCVEQVVIYLACLRLGVVISPVPVQYREHELSQILDVIEPKAAITAAHIAKVDSAGMFLALAAATGRSLRVLALGDAVPEGAVAVAAWCDSVVEPDRACLARHLAAHPVSAHDVVTICWTSGTESVPKGVPRNHNEWRVIGDGVRGSVGLADGCRLLNPFPLTNLGGIGGLLLPWLLSAGTLVQHHPFSLPAFLEQLRTERIDYTVAPPSLLNMLLAREELLAGVDFKRLRSIGSGSAPLSEWMVKTYAERFGVQIVNYFGSNEGTALIGTPLDIADPALRASYYPRFGVAGFTWASPVSAMIETRLVDAATGETIEKAGTPGELRIRGASIFAGYYRAPALTAAAFDDEGFFRTGDLFEIAGAGNELYRFVGRLKDIVIRGGVNISSEEIEVLLLEHPSVADAAVIGYPDERLGEKLCAVVVPKKDAALDLAALCSFLHDKKRIAQFKLPERLEVVEVLPRNPIGKVLKRELRARFY